MSRPVLATRVRRFRLVLIEEPGDRIVLRLPYLPERTVEAASHAAGQLFAFAGAASKIRQAAADFGPALERLYSAAKAATAPEQPRRPKRGR